MKRILKSLFVLLVFVNLDFSSASAAGLLISIDKLQQAGDSGSFELVLTNTEAPGGTTYNVAGFSFEMLATAGTDLMFTAADYPTGTPPYIFDGTGQTSFDPGIPLSNDVPPPTNDLNGSDSEFISLSGIAVAPGDPFSLGLISFTSSSTVSVSDLLGMIVRDGTVLSDANFQPIPYSLPNVAVPEPSSLVMLGFAGAIVLVGGMRRRSS